MYFGHPNFRLMESCVRLPHSEYIWIVIRCYVDRISCIEYNTVVRYRFLSLPHIHLLILSIRGPSSIQDISRDHSSKRTSFLITSVRDLRDFVSFLQSHTYTPDQSTFLFPCRSASWLEHYKLSIHLSVNSPGEWEQSRAEKVD